MIKRLSLVIAAFAVALGTTLPARAQTATQEAKEKTKSAAQKTGQYLSDAEITTAVKSKLLADKLVGGLKIDVETDHRVVTLTGPVDSAAEKAHAIKLARQTHGVRRVVNKLTIEKKSSATGTSGKKNEGAVEKTGNALGDAEITSVVKTKLVGDSGVHSMDVHVDTDKGIVTLTGSVRSEAEKAEAVRVARDTSGVKRVVDKLVVK